MESWIFNAEYPPEFLRSSTTHTYIYLHKIVRNRRNSEIFLKRLEKVSSFEKWIERGDQTKIGRRELFRKLRSARLGSARLAQIRKRETRLDDTRAVCNSIPTAPWQPWKSSDHAAHLLSAVSTGIHVAGVSLGRWSTCGTCCPDTWPAVYSHPESVFPRRDESLEIWTVG